jgi:hypothetical protein
MRRNFKTQGTVHDIASHAALLRAFGARQSVAGVCQPSAALDITTISIITQSANQCRPLLVATVSSSSTPQPARRSGAIVIEKGAQPGVGATASAPPDFCRLGPCRAHRSAAKHPPSLGVHFERVGLPPLMCNPTTHLDIDKSTIRFACCGQATDLHDRSSSPAARRMHRASCHQCVHVATAASSMLRSAASDMRALASDVSNHTSRTPCFVCFC